MAEQLSLAGFETPAPPTDRLFFAILPDAKTAARIAKLAQQLRNDHGLKGKPLAAERLHITLCFLGDFAGLPQNIIAKASEVASSLVWPSFELGLDRVSSFLGKRKGLPLVLRGGDGIGALMDFQRVLFAALIKAGVKSEGKLFVPHVTLQYDDQRVPEQIIETVSWTAHEFVLVHSLVGQSRHVTLARWPLRG